MVTHHYLNNKDCNFDKHAKIMAIEQIKCHNDKNVSTEKKMEILLKREKFWQRELNTFIDGGMNKRDG